MQVYTLIGNAKHDVSLIYRHICEENSVFVLDAPIHLYDYIEELPLNGEQLLQLRICKEVSQLNLDCRITNESVDVRQINHIQSFSRLLTVLDDTKAYHITVNQPQNKGKKDASQLVKEQQGEIIQQLIYLQIPLSRVHVRTPEEKIAAESLQYSLMRIEEIAEKVESAKRILDKERRSKHVWKRQDAKQYLRRISRLLDTISIINKSSSIENDLILAVTASKKTGKSVIVNGMIGYRLSPDSIETPTPNNCIYQRGKRFVLDDSTRTTYFSDASQLRKALRERFNIANKNAANNRAIPDMQITFPPTEITFGQYVIVDTPGPDYAGSSIHRESMQRAVKSADIVLFAIDYSKHFTQSEYAYLKYVRDTLKEQGKENSLIIAVNQIDKCYNTKEAKSIPRILDYLRQGLIEIDPSFSEVFFVGTSALTYLACIESVGIPQFRNLFQVNGLASLDDCFDQCCDNDSLTVLSFIDEITKKVKRFHRYNITDIAQLEKFSGMPTLFNCIDEIAKDRIITKKITRLTSYAIDLYDELEPLIDDILEEFD